MVHSRTNLDWRVLIPIQINVIVSYLKVFNSHEICLFHHINQTDILEDSYIKYLAYDRSTKPCKKCAFYTYVEVKTVKEHTYYLFI